MDLEARIAQFENMASADPDNDMAHFSLGGAYQKAGRYADAAASFERCYAINPDMSKAYQLAAECRLEAGDEEAAARIATEGYPIAASKGDLLPRNAMGELLQKMGRPVPQLDDETKAAAERLEASGAFVCKRTGRPGSQLPSPPFRGPVGAWIHENISAETWRDWIGQGTKVINELRLDLSRDEDAETYDRHMREYLGIDDELHAKLRAGA